MTEDIITGAHAMTTTTPPDTHLLCCMWVTIPGPGETTACSGCGTTFTGAARIG